MDLNFFFLLSADVWVIHDDKQAICIIVIKSLSEWHSFEAFAYELFLKWKVESDFIRMNDW